MTSKIIYQGELRTKATHIKSDTSIITDAPTDNNGKGSSFSPTDLVATALASCAMTIMGIAADNHKINIEGASAEVVKIMGSDPRRIAEVQIQIHMPEKSYSTKEVSILEKAALTCPVAKSLHPELVQQIQFHWK